MKLISEYKSKLGLNTQDDVFSFLTNSLKESNRTYDYYVNWNKVFSNVDSINIELNLLNSLIGSTNIENDCKALLAQYPEVIKAFPFLLAIRDNNITVLHNYSLSGFTYKHFNFKYKKGQVFTPSEIDELVAFLKGAKLLEIFSNKKVKNLVDYTTGTEVGLDSNGRKNRSGTTMEGIVEFFIQHICQQNNWEYLTQANSVKVKAKWPSITLPYQDSDKNIDFVIHNGISLYLIETNYYGGGGSKLKSTAGEYQKMFNLYQNNGFKFIWITDGLGWKTAERPLRDAFNDLDFILNLEMLTSGILEDILKKNY